MALFKKKCKYCGIKINKGKEVWTKVKVPEFKELKLKTFCCSEHAEIYKKFIKGTPSRNNCPYCKN